MDEMVEEGIKSIIHQPVRATRTSKYLQSELWIEFERKWYQWKRNTIIYFRTPKPGLPICGHRILRAQYEFMPRCEEL